MLWAAVTGQGLGIAGEQHAGRCCAKLQAAGAEWTSGLGRPAPPSMQPASGRAPSPPVQRAELNERAEAMSAALTRERLSNTVDTTGTTIGKR